MTKQPENVFHIRESGGLIWTYCPEETATLQEKYSDRPYRWFVEMDGYCHAVYCHMPETKTHQAGTQQGTSDPDAGHDYLFTAEVLALAADNTIKYAYDDFKKAPR